MSFYEKDNQKRPEHVSMPESEWAVDERFPDFEREESPVVKVELDIGVVWLTADNTLMVTYEQDGQYEHMDHIMVKDAAQFDDPLFIFPMPNPENKSGSEYDETFDLLYYTLQEVGFSTLYIPSQPSDDIFERYYRFIRGDESMDAVLRRVIEGSLDE